MEVPSWSKLKRLQLGKYAEYFAKMEFTRHGFDVYTAEVDDKGIDFVIRKSESTYYDVQVKSVRGWNYVFFPKSKFSLRDNLLGVVVHFAEGKPPNVYVIRSTEWRKPSKLLVSRDYKDRKSPPEWGVNLSQRNFLRLSQFSLEKMVKLL